MKTTIEVGPRRTTPTAPAAEIKEQAAQRAATAPVLAKQRATKRAKGSSSILNVDRSATGPSVRQEAKREAKIDIDLGVPTRWQRAYSLPHVEAPAGYALCYIARHRNRHGDERGTLGAFREGWRPILADEIDEDDLPTETLTGRLGKYGPEVIGDETTILMKMPLEVKAQRDAHYNGVRDAATRAVTRRNPGLDVGHPSLPLVEDVNQVSVDTPRMRARRPSASRDAPA